MVKSASPFGINVAYLGILLCGTAVGAAHYESQSHRKDIANKEFDPSKYKVEFCDLPPYVNSSTAFKPSRDVCIGFSVFIQDMDSERIQTLAEAYAPFLFFHPLETFTMSSVERTFENSTEGQIYRTSDKSVFDDELRPSSLLSNTRDPDLALSSHDFHIEHSLDFDYKLGDGFDDNGLSRAPIYYRAFDSGNGTITFNYFFYFTWNGPTNLGLISSYNGTNQYVRFLQPPFAVHEADWESLSVTACVSDTIETPLAVTYRQRNYGQIMDCTKGECLFFVDHPTNVVGFVALNSHAVYPTAATEMVYEEVSPLEFFVNLQAVLLVDRLAYADKEGNYRYFAPNASNVVRLKEQTEIPSLANESEYWGAFGGRWGRTEQYLGSAFTPEWPVCLDDSTTEYAPCPTEEENPPFHLALKMLGVEETDSALIQGASNLVDFLVDFFSQTHIASMGPAVSTFYSRYEIPFNAPIWREVGSVENEAAFCNNLSDIPDTFRLPVEKESVPLVENTIGVACMFIFFTLFNVVLVTRHKMRRLRPVVGKDEQGAYQKPGKLTRSLVFEHLWSLVGAYVFTMLGMVLFFIGHASLTHLLAETVSFLNWDVVDGCMITVAVFNTISNTLLIGAGWFQCEDLWLRINRTYFELIEDEDGVDRFEWESRYSESVLRIKRRLNARSFSIAFAVLNMSLVLAVFMVTSGVYDVGFSYMFGTLCRALVGSLDGVCFKFPAFGGDIKCGADFQEFCRDWARVETIITLWGGFMVVVGNFYLIVFASLADVNITYATQALLAIKSTASLSQISSMSISRVETKALIGNSEDGSLPKNENANDTPLLDETSAGDEGSNSLLLSPIESLNSVPQR